MFFFPRLLGVRPRERILAVLWVFSLFFPKTARKRRSGPETIRENQALRANPRIDSRESGHLSIRRLEEAVVVSGVFSKQQPKGPLTEDPSTQESDHDHGQGRALYGPMPS